MTYFFIRFLFKYFYGWGIYTVFEACTIMYFGINKLWIKIKYPIFKQEHNIVSSGHNLFAYLAFSYTGSDI